MTPAAIRTAHTLLGEREKLEKALEGLLFPSDLRLDAVARNFRGDRVFSLEDFDIVLTRLFETVLQQKLDGVNEELKALGVTD